MLSINNLLTYFFIIFLTITTSISTNNIPPDDEYPAFNVYPPPRHNMGTVYDNSFFHDPKLKKMLENDSRSHYLNMHNQENIDVKAELNKLPINYVSQELKWPRMNFTNNNNNNNKLLGAVSAVSFDLSDNIVVFHRAERIWNENTFNLNNIYMQRMLGSIKQNTIIAFNRQNGTITYEWGKNLFYMPHGLTIDFEGNTWITDVALHQVMKFSKNHTLELILGDAFKPGQGNRFCKPTAVSVLENGDFFVSDGYCNSRIIKFSKNGDLLIAWGKSSFQGASHNYAPQNFFAVPHALTVAIDLNLLCVADRENGRIQCFHIGNGTFHSQYHSEIVGDRIFSVSYAPINGGQLFVINGPQSNIHYSEIHGFVLDMKTKKVLSKFGPLNALNQFSNPHDLIVSSDGNEIYVTELDPPKIYKFLNNLTIITDTVVNVKPTATLDDPNAPPIMQTVLSSQKMEPGATALLVVSLIVLFVVLTFGLALLISKRRKRGCTTPCGTRNRRHAWEFPTVKSDGFKLGNLLDRKRGFEKLDQDASDEEPNATTNMLSSAQFA